MGPMMKLVQNHIPNNLVVKAKHMKLDYIMDIGLDLMLVALDRMVSMDFVVSDRKVSMDFVVLDRMDSVMMDSDCVVHLESMDTLLLLLHCPLEVHLD